MDYRIRRKSGGKQSEAMKLQRLHSAEVIGMVWYGIVEFNVPLDTV